jgi:hypothetical protein
MFGRTGVEPGQVGLLVDGVANLLPQGFDIVALLLRRRECHPFRHRCTFDVSAFAGVSVRRLKGRPGHASAGPAGLARSG